MRYLLDTHVLIWWLLADRRLTKRAKALIADPQSVILVSSASAWEITTKHRIGKLDGVDALVRDVAEWVGRASFVALPISIAHAQRAGSYAQDHRDPFDRMLAAQGELEDVPLVTGDKALKAFGTRTVW